MQSRLFWVVAQKGAISKGPGCAPMVRNSGGNSCSPLPTPTEKTHCVTRHSRLWKLRRRGCRWLSRTWLWGQATCKNCGTSFRTLSDDALLRKMVRGVHAPQRSLRYWPWIWIKVSHWKHCLPSGPLWLCQLFEIKSGHEFVTMNLLVSRRARCARNRAKPSFGYAFPRNCRLRLKWKSLILGVSILHVHIPEKVTCWAQAYHNVPCLSPIGWWKTRMKVHVVFN